MTENDDDQKVQKDTKMLAAVFIILILVVGFGFVMLSVFKGN